MVNITQEITPQFVDRNITMTDGDEAPPTEEVFGGTLRLVQGVEWSDELSDPTSQEYQELALDMETMVSCVHKGYLYLQRYLASISRHNIEVQ